MLNVEDLITADQTASEILTFIKTVDGGGSGLELSLEMVDNSWRSNNMVVLNLQVLIYFIILVQQLMM